jgi:hypothetical protein
MNRYFFARIILALIVLIAVSNDPSSTSEELPPPANSISDSSAIHKGTVASFFDEDGYTYIKYQDGNVLSWVAVLQVPVQLKDSIEFPDNQVLRNYQSRTLKEPFSSIIFATEITISGPKVSSDSPSEEVKSDKVVPATQGEITSDKPVPAVTEEDNTKNQPAPKAEVMPKRFIPRKMVVSSMSTAGYSYIEYEENGVLSWVAVPETAVTAGDIIEFPDSQIIKNFTSKSLGKTFARLYMASELRIVLDNP